MKLTNSQLATAIMRAERKPRTLDSEDLLRRLRAERDRRAAACRSRK